MRLSIFVALLLALPIQLYGQVPNCASFPLFADTSYVNDFSAPFSAPSYDSWRQQNGVTPQPAGTIGSAITDPTTCQAVLDAAQTEMQARSDWTGVLQHGYTSGVLMIGPYYVVAIDEQPATGTMPMTTVTQLMVLQASDLSYVGRLVIVG